MRIGFLTAELTHRNGWAHYSRSLLDALHRVGVSPVAISAENSPTDAAYPVLPVLPALTPAAPQRMLRMLRTVPRVQRLLREVELVHALVEPYAPLAHWVHGKKPFLISAHGTYARAGADRHAVVGGFYRRAFHQADRVICVSQYTAAVAAGYLPGIKTTVIHNGVDPARFAYPERLPKAPGQPPIVLTAGGVKQRKGTLELIAAMAVVRAALPEVQCVILGSTTAEPKTTAAAQALIHRLELTECVHLLGFVDEADLLGWFAKADVFVLPAMNDGHRFEGFGLAYLEAAAAGLPSIGTTGSGAAEAIEAGITGLLVPQAEIHTALPTAILQVLQHPQLARQMGAAGRHKAQQQTWDAVARQVMAVYAELLR